MYSNYIDSMIPINLLNKQLKFWCNRNVLNLKKKSENFHQKFRMFHKISEFQAKNFLWVLRLWNRALKLNYCHYNYDFEFNWSTIGCSYRRIVFLDYECHAIWIKLSKNIGSNPHAKHTHTHEWYFIAEFNGGLRSKLSV